MESTLTNVPARPAAERAGRRAPALRMGDWPLAAKMLTLWILLSTTLTLGITALGYARSQEGLQGQANQALLDSASQVARDIDEWDGQQISDLQVLAALTPIRHTVSGNGVASAADLSLAQDALGSLDAARNDLDSVALLDSQGKYLLSTTTDVLGTAVPQRDYFQQAMQGKAFVSGATISLVTDQPVIFFSVPVKDVNGNVAGVLRSRSPLANLAGRVASGQAQGKGAVGVLLDQHGLVVASTLDAGWQLRPVTALDPAVRDELVKNSQWGKDEPPAPIDQPELAQAVGAKGTKAFVWHVRGAAYQAIAVPVSGTPWTYVVAMPMDAYAQPARAFRQEALEAAALGILASAILAALLTRTITRQVAAVARAARRFSEGDLTAQAVVGGRDEVGQMAAAFNRMVETARLTVAAIRAGVSDLTAASTEILAAAAQQAAGATEQSAAIAETTATVEEVKASAEQTTQAAMAMAETAEEASRAAGEGVTAVAQATVGMDDLRSRVQTIAEHILALAEQSQRIGEIITTVSDLADQSNLLALNAAIEASRAGEQGRAFKVVADQIRSLAEQSKAATVQVRTILAEVQRATNAAVLATEQGTKGADAGGELIEQAGRTIDELARVNEEAARTAQQIAASVRQHTIGMEQIALAMGNINQAMGQNLAATDAAKQAAEHLDGLARRLGQVIAHQAV